MEVTVNLFDSVFHFFLKYYEQKTNAALFSFCINMPSF